MYTSPEFMEVWDIWKKHYSQKNGTAYTETSESMALRMLFKKSHGIEDLAIQSIEESIEKNWAAIYIKKDYNNGKQGNPNQQQSGFRDSVKEEFNRRYGTRQQAAN